MFSSGVTTLMVADFNRSVQFYTETLGCRADYVAENKWAQLDAGGGYKIGIHPKREHDTFGSAMSIGFYVTEPLEEVMKTLEGKGVSFRGPVDDDGGIRLAFFHDPDGHELYLCEYTGG
jgi:catechol 2,3-dioxygenase-like lactoylglutathione lyase family enzyme